MTSTNGKLLRLPKKGKALIITDLHGNLEDFYEYQSIWNDFGKNGNHIVITGDLIHSFYPQKDGSIDILESIITEFERDNFHVLLGNHEWSHITNIPVYKAGQNQKSHFETLLKERFGCKWQEKLDYYKKFFKKLPLAIKTANRVFISHAGPSNNIKNLEEINITSSNKYHEDLTVYGMLWTRYDNLNEIELLNFLNKVKCNVSVVGHTKVDGYQLMGEKQIILSSSYSKGRKAYLELDLEEEIGNAYDVLGMIKYLN